MTLVKRTFAEVFPQLKVLSVNNRGSRGFPLKDNIPGVFGGQSKFPSGNSLRDWSFRLAKNPNKKHFSGTVHQP